MIFSLLKERPSKALTSFFKVAPFPVKDIDNLLRSDDKSLRTSKIKEIQSISIDIYLIVKEQKLYTSTFSTPYFKALCVNFYTDHNILWTLKNGALKRISIVYKTLCFVYPVSDRIVCINKYSRTQFNLKQRSRAYVWVT